MGMSDYGVGKARHRTSTLIGERRYIVRLPVVPRAGRVERVGDALHSRIRGRCHGIGDRGAEPSKWPEHVLTVPDGSGVAVDEEKDLRTVYLDWQERQRRRRQEST